MNPQTHYAAKDLVGLPGMPGSERGVQKKAERENWQYREVDAKGGPGGKRREYALSSLPAETRDYLANQVISARPEIKPETAVAIVAPAALPATATLKEWQRRPMDARIAIMRLIERAAPAIGVRNAINKIVIAAANGDLPELAAANVRKGASRTLSYDGIMKWWRKWKASGGDYTVLAPKDVENYQEPAWAKAFMECWGQPQKPCLTDVLNDLQPKLPAHVPMPSYGQARHYLQKLGLVEREKGRKTGKELQALKPFRRRITSHMYPGDAYTADGHCFDGEVAHPYHGRPFRPEITPVIDVATRMTVGWSVDLAESGLAVLDALRGACENYGPPVIFYTDNGSGYKNQMMTAPGTGILHRLGITPEYSRPRNPQAHGLSERAHQTILIKAAKQLCTYIGQHMDGDAKRLVYKETRKAVKTGTSSQYLLEWDDFVAHINLAIIEYNNRPHSGLPALRDPITKKRVHMTPAQAWHVGMERMKRELPQEQWTQPANELPDLYHPAVERTVARGEIQLGTLANGLPKVYYSRDLENWKGKVQVAFNPTDGSKVWVRDLEHNRLLAVAELGGNASPYFAPSYLDEKREKRADARAKRLELQLEEVELERRGPAAIVVEPNPDIQQARLELVRKIEAEEAELANTFRLPESDRERQYLWQELDARKQAKNELSQEEAGFWRSWQSSPTWKGWKTIQDDLQRQAATN